jgi:hypothetical protein
MTKLKVGVFEHLADINHTSKCLTSAIKNDLKVFCKKAIGIDAASEAVIYMLQVGDGGVIMIQIHIYNRAYKSS